MTAADQSLAELAHTSKAWPFEEARKLLKRLEKADPAREVVFETAYGPSGLAHLRRGDRALGP
jgi:lysyl-tRNA synthetase class 1